MIYAMKLIFAILELTPTLLIKKSSISIVKLILEKIIRLTNSQHSDLQKNVLLHKIKGIGISGQALLSENLTDG
jgi:hypothetical protein